MDESPLDKVLRLAAVRARSYIRVEHGVPQRVSQYVQQRRGPGQVLPSPGQRPPIPPPAAKKPVGKSEAFGSLKVGQTVQVRANKYKVLRVKVPPLTTRNLGQNVNTGGPQNTGSAGQNVNTGGSPQQALLGNVKIKPGTPSSTSEWRDLSTGKTWFVTLPDNMPVQVVA